MLLGEKDLYILLSHATSAAQEAGSVLNAYSREHLEVRHKENAASLAGAVVTEADYRSQEIILNSLEPTLADFNLALLSEESPDDQSRFEKDFFWCIDPLDGSLPFTEGSSGYAVSIALVSKEGESVIGVVYHPPTDTIWHAIKNVGIFRNGEKWLYQLDQSTEGAVKYFVDRSFLTDANFPRTKVLLDRAESRRSGKKADISNIGGAVMQAITMLEHPEACYFKFPRLGQSGGSLWDYAATHCIYRELNLIAEDFFQQPMELNRAESTFMNHRGILFATNRKIANDMNKLYLDIAAQ